MVVEIGSVVGKAVLRWKLVKSYALVRLGDCVVLDQGIEERVEAMG